MNPTDDLKVEFDEETSDSGWGAIKYYREPNAPKMVQWAIKLSNGLIKDEKQASYLLIAVAIVAFALSFYLVFGGSKVSPEITKEMLELMKRAPGVYR